MPAHSETQHSPYTPRQLFDLVSDIERYPEFLPWCRAARIIERREGQLLAELIIAFGHLTERYTSRVELKSPECGEAAIDVTLVEGPFKHLINRWRFTPEEGGTRIDFFIDFAFRSRILEGLIGGMFGRALAAMMEAFSRRAEALYGHPQK